MRVIVGLVALATAGTAAFFIVKFEQQIVGKRAGVRLFDTHAREAIDALADVRVAQIGYVAAGQGVAFWIPKVSSTSARAAESIADLRSMAVAPATRSALDDAAATVDEFKRVDTRARGYISSSQPLMAADVIFTEGEQTAAEAARHIEEARLAEQQALESEELLIRKQQAAAAAGAAAVMTVMLLMLVPVPRGERRDVEASTAVVAPARSPLSDARAIVEPRRPAVPTGNAMLAAAAVLCTEFGTVSDLDEINRLLARVSEAMDASGLIVWLNVAGSAELDPVLAHGYSPQVLARMGRIPRNASNAAAAAVRSSQLQIVLGRPGGSSGAVVAPLLGPDGCIGALSAEIRGGAESSEGVQALAAIFAAQLAGIIHVAPVADAEPRRSAANG